LQPDVTAFQLNSKTELRVS